MIFWQVLLPEGTYRCQAPCADFLETLGLRGAQKQPKIVKNGQKWPKMTQLDYHMVKLPKFWYFRLNGQQLSQTMDQASYMLTLSNV